MLNKMDNTQETKKGMKKKTIILISVISAVVVLLVIGLLLASPWNTEPLTLPDNSGTEGTSGDEDIGNTNEEELPPDTALGDIDNALEIIEFL